MILKFFFLYSPINFSESPYPFAVSIKFKLLSSHVLITFLISSFFIFLKLLTIPYSNEKFAVPMIIFFYLLFC